VLTYEFVQNFKKYLLILLTLNVLPTSAVQ